MKVLMDGVSSAAGFRSRDMMCNLLINAQHHTIIPIDAKTPKAALGSSSNSATISIGVNAVFRPRVTFDTKQGMINREQYVGRTSWSTSSATSTDTFRRERLQPLRNRGVHFFTIWLQEPTRSAFKSANPNAMQNQRSSEPSPDIPTTTRRR